MKQARILILLGALLAGAGACSSGTDTASDDCAPNLDDYVSLETRARPDDPLGITAQSTLQYLTRENLPTTGFYLSRKPMTSEADKVEYQLIHESGFDKPCAAGNRSGMDGVLEIDPATREVTRFVRSQ